MAVSVPSIARARARAGLSRLLLNPDEPDLRVRISRDAAGTLTLRATTLGLAFVASVLLARLLGPEGYGAYAYAFTWVTVLGVLALMGLDRLLVREIVTYRARGAWGPMRGFLRRANQAALVGAIALASLVALATWALGGLGSETMSALWVAVILLPLIVLNRIRQLTLQGLDYVVLGQVPEALIQPVLLIAMVVGGFVLLDGDVSAAGAMGMAAAAAGVSLIVGRRLVRRLLPGPVRVARPEYETSAWVRSALPLLVMGLLMIVSSRVGILMLGPIRGPEDTGVYAVVQRMAEFIPFFMIGLGPVLSPIIARLHVEGDLERLERVVTRSALAVFLVTLPIALALIGFGHQVLTLFGPEFTQGHTALAILVVGQLVNVATGMVSVVLIMTGHERDATVAAGVGALASVLLSAVLIPSWGIEGAAVAAATSMVLWNGLAVFYVHRRLGIHTMPFRLGMRKAP
jgi:O-antigen/teichoic acid export membrane protein